MSRKNLFFEYQETLYPSYIKHGHAADHVIPIAKHFCIGKGLDIGGQKDCHFPGARIINLDLKDGFTSGNLPDEKYDYIFSSHTLEHIPALLNTLLYWRNHLKPGGVLFLYLPHWRMTYWLPTRCKKHLHIFEPEGMRTTLMGVGFKNVLFSERDLFWSFAIVGVKGK